MAGEFDGLRALVTGGASGIGLATAELLAERGAAVVCLDRVEAQPPPPLRAVCGDVSSDAVRDVVARAVADLGGLDVLVNNAGVLAQGTVEDSGLDEWRRLFETNVLGIVRVSGAALPWLRRSPVAAIVNTCSLGALVGLPRAAPYCASKGAVYALTMAMAADHLREGIRVNCVVPAPVDTPWLHRAAAAAPDPAARLAAAAARQPNGRLVSAREVAAAICYLAGPSAGATTGTSVTVDGGTRGVLIS